MNLKDKFRLRYLLTAMLVCGLFASAVLGQVRELRIHDRGMLHETVFNTGEIAQPYHYDGFQHVNTPMMEWPSRSKTIVEGIEYSGQHNIFGGGVYIGANEEGSMGWQNRLIALCGGCGKGDNTEPPLGLWSFPLSMSEVENYPVLPNGELNPDYDPNEAEEIISSSWATNVGITVTRTSRAWSYPDYDDFIIYEYEFEYTGDTDGVPSTMERDKTLYDVLVVFQYGFGVSMYGYQRYYNEWLYSGGFKDSDMYGYWDFDYWMQWDQDLNLAGDWDKPAKPEPILENFLEFAETGKNGGGMASPQAVGNMILYYDTDHLAVVDPEDLDRNESQMVGYGTLSKYDSIYFEIDDNGHILQPYHFSRQKGAMQSEKILEKSLVDVRERRRGPWQSEEMDDDPIDIAPAPRWVGRGKQDLDNLNVSSRMAAFGPYTMNPGDKISFAIAELAGYGAKQGKTVFGGSLDEAYTEAVSGHYRVKVEDEIVTENYLEDYGYPDYVNSDVRDIHDVAHKAWEAYLGEEIPYDADAGKPATTKGYMWPETDSPEEGIYTIPIPVPAPAIKVINTVNGNVHVSWKDAVEDFDAPRLTGALDHFNIYRAEAGMGPWTLVGTIQKGQKNSDGMYEYYDEDETFKVGETKYFAVTSVDEHGNESGKTNITQHTKNIGPVTTLGDVYVVPNPFVVESGFVGAGERSVRQLGFYGLPERCTIRIFSYAGQLIETIEHDDPEYSTEWFQVTRSNQIIASGMYFYVVSTPEGKKTTGKFLVIK